MHLQRLEETGKPVGKFTNTFWPRRNSFKTYFLFRRRLPTRTALSLFIVTSLRPTVTQTLELDGPIVRRVKNPPIGKAHIYPCDFAGY